MQRTFAWVSITLALTACAGSGRPDSTSSRPAASAPAAAAPVIKWVPAEVVSTAGARIAYYVAGARNTSQPPLIAISGGPGSDHRYLRVGGAFERLARQRTVVMFDQRSTGRSSPAGDAPKISHWSDDVEAIRRALQAPKVDILGHSFGGLVAMAYLKDHADRVRSVTFVDSSAPKLSANKQLLADVYPDRIDQWRKTRAALPAKFAAPDMGVFFSMEFVGPAHTKAYLAAVADFVYDISVNNALRAELRTIDYSSVLKDLAVPALIVHGRQDAVLAPVVAADLAALIPRSTLAFIDSAGHLPFVEQPAAFTETVASFLNGVSSRQPSVDRLTEPCTVPGVEREVRCGQFEVFEDRKAQAGRKVALRFTVVPATGSPRRTDPIVPIAGGPGDSVRRAAAGFVNSYKALLDERDLVLIDVRGTGDSDVLGCSFPQASSPLGQLQQFLPAEGVSACAQALGETRNLRAYTTRAIVDDLHEVLVGLGYSEANLVGASYGTRVAQVFMRRHPDYVRSAHLHGTTHLGEFIPLAFARDAQAALDGVFAECAAETPCRTAFGHLPTKFNQALAEVERAPPTVTVQSAKGSVKEPFTRAAFVQTVRYMTYLSASAQEIPLAIHLASTGDYSVLARYASMFSQFLGGTSDGLYLSVTCTEDLPFITQSDVAPAVDGTYLGAYRIRQQKEACARWPHDKVDAAFHAPIKSAIPTLLVTGERDPVTPPRAALQTARGLSNSAVLIVPDGGHDHVGLEGTDCVQSLVQTLIRTADARDLDVEGCKKQIKRPVFPVSVPAPAIALTPNQAAKYAGEYSADGAPVRVAVLVDGDRLQITGLGNAALALVPVSQTEFRFEHLPPSFRVTFRIDDGRVSGLTLTGTGQPDLRLNKAK